MQDFRKLTVWREAHALTLRVYGCTRSFPKDEMYGLTSQLRRSAASIGANIAEGCGRKQSRDLARFLRIAMGSASETEYHLLLAHDLGFFDKRGYSELERAITGIKRMLTALLARVMEEADLRGASN
jgi:four helix bundle protein